MLYTIVAKSHMPSLSLTVDVRPLPPVYARQTYLPSNHLTLGVETRVLSVA